MQEVISQWEVTKYGEKIETTDINLPGIVFITTKLYKYKDRYFQELWNSGYCVHFSEVIEC